MGEREYILAGNYKLLDGLYRKLREEKETSSKRYQFILKQQHEINELKATVARLNSELDGVSIRDGRESL